LELLNFKKENIPVRIEEISQFLGVSISQAYEEIRKWRTLGLLEFVKMQKPTGDFEKGYMLSANTVNRLIDKVESSVAAFLRETRRLAKDFDDIFMLEFVRKEK
jgi:predicted transcriptional regulator